MDPSAIELAIGGGAATMSGVLVVAARWLARRLREQAAVVAAEVGAGIAKDEQSPIALIVRGELQPISAEIAMIKRDLASISNTQSEQSQLLDLLISDVDKLQTRVDGMDQVH
jgi:hypothetical protein